MSANKLPTFFISHGGGPWPWMQGQMLSAHENLAPALRAIPDLIGVTPKAILMISAHWEAAEFTLMTHATPPMIYDYSGFPPHTYHVQYPALGAPILAERVGALLTQAMITVRMDAGRGFDHGVYVPLAVIYPKANIPVVQLSLKRGLEPGAHLALGRALAPLREEGVVIMGSGSSYHNLRAFGPEARAPSTEFDTWLQHSLSIPDSLSRSVAIAKWEAAPSARQAHPREEHLLPLMVALGAAEEDSATLIYHEKEFFGGATVSSFMFGGR